jgi:hypothetical protein
LFKISANDSAVFAKLHRKLCFHEKILQKRMMCEVREAESTSGGVSAESMWSEVAERIFDHIGKSIGEVRAKLNEKFNFDQRSRYFFRELNYEKM